jgi:hypothetical protein
MATMGPIGHVAFVKAVERKGIREKVFLRRACLLEDRSLVFLREGRVFGACLDMRF